MALASCYDAGLGTFAARLPSRLRCSAWHLRLCRLRDDRLTAVRGGGGIVQIMTCRLPEYLAPTKGTFLGGSMLRSLPLLQAATLVLLVAGCTRNTLIIVAPQATPRRATDACRRPPGSPPLAPLQDPELQARQQVPEAARRSKTPGCAGVEFRVGADGVARDVRVVVESPQGLGYGEAAVAAIRGNRYTVRPVETGPHYHAYGVTFRS